MESLDKLLDRVRNSTRNSDDTSIADSEFIEAFNDAQDRCQSILTKVNPDLFIEEEIIDLVAGQEAYSITNKVYLNTRIKTVEYSYTGDIRDYRELPAKTFKERATDSGSPSFYIRRENGFLLNCIPDSSIGKIRVTYEKELLDLDIRRALVTSTTGTPITAITLNNGTFPTSTDITALTTGDYISIVSAYGVKKAVAIPVTSATATSITIPSHTLASGESISAGDYVVIGKYASSHSGLPDACERYLRTYVHWIILNRDHSEQARAKYDELLAIEQDLRSAYATPSKDVIYPIILDDEVM